MAAAVELTEFCLERGRRCFANWPTQTLFAYCFFHLVSRGAFFCRQNGKIVAALFAWTMPEALLRTFHAEHKPVFDWRTRPTGPEDAIFLAEVMGDQQFLPVLVRRVSARWPDWDKRKIFTYRHGELVELPAATIKRLAAGDGKHRVAAAEDGRTPSPDRAGAKASAVEEVSAKG